MFPKSLFFHYLPVNDLNIRWGIYVTGAGTAVIPPGTEYPPQGHPELYDFQWDRGRTSAEFQLVLITDGRGVFESRETGQTVIEPGSVLLMLPGKWHRYRPDPKTGWTERWIGFHGEIAHRLLRSLDITKACLVTRTRQSERLYGGRDGLSALEALENRFDELLERIHSQPAQNSTLLSMHALALVAEAIEHSSAVSQAASKPPVPEGGGVEDDLVVRARELIWTHSHRQLSVQQIARELSVTRRMLERRFQAATGESPLHDIVQCRFSRAKRLLLETDLPTKTIAYLAGFASDEQMRVTFNRLAGHSPSTYRQAGRSGGRAIRRRVRDKRRKT